MPGNQEEGRDNQGRHLTDKVDVRPATPLAGLTTKDNRERAGLTFTDQAPANAVAAVTLDDVTPTGVWREIATAEQFPPAFVDAVLDAVRGLDPADIHEALEDAALTGADVDYRSLILRIARGDDEAVWTLLRRARGIGTGWSRFENALGLARLFRLALERAPDRDVPTVAVRVTGDFLDEVRADQRRAVCELVATLARGCDVRLVSTGLTRRSLAEKHADDLPGVSEACSTPPGGQAPVDELVSAALTDLDSGGTDVTVLRLLADEPGQTLTYSELYAEVPRDESTVRATAGALEEAALVSIDPHARSRKVTLLEAGRRVVDTLDAEIGRQRRLTDDCKVSTGEGERSSSESVNEWTNGAPGTPSETGHSSSSDASELSVSETGKSCVKDRVTPAAHEGPPTGEGEAEPFQVRYMDAPAHAAAAGSAVDGGVTLVDHPFNERDHPRTHRVSYDDARDEAVVSIRASGALPYAVSVAVALASPRFIDRVLPVSRLEEIDDPAAILRGARQIGYLSDEALADRQVLRDNLVEWGLTVQDLSRKARREADQEACKELRSEAMKQAHGLAGSIAQLLEAVGTDLVREVRVPGRLNRERALEPLAKSVAISAGIQSRYGAFAFWRLMFEHREEKRASALTPEVDAADPFGDLIGSIVIRGPDLHRFEGSLTDALEAPADVHEDAPEIALSVPVTWADRRAPYADAVQRMCTAKNMEPTSEAVSFLQALTGSPHDVTWALQQLGREPTPRRIHLDEVRYALATLPADRILPDAAPTVRKTVHALLTASRPLTQAELAERAGVSARSVRNHAERLEAFALIEATGDGYRLALPFREERGPAGDAHLPWYLTPNGDRDDYRDATEKGVLYEAVIERAGVSVDDVLQVFDLITTLQIPPEARREIEALWPWAPPLLEAVRVLAGDEPAREFTDTVTLGAEPEQAALPAHPPTADRAEGIDV